MRYGTGVALTLSAVQVDILSHTCCVDTKRCSCGSRGKFWRALGTKTNTKVTLRYGTGVALTLSAVQVDILSHTCCVDTKRCSCGSRGKFWRALGTKTNTKVTLRYGTGVALTLSAVQVDILSHTCCVDTKRCSCGSRGKFWRGLGTKTNTKVTLQQEESLRQLKV